MASGKASSGYTRGRIGLMSSNPLRNKSSSRRLALAGYMNWPMISQSFRISVV